MSTETRPKPRPITSCSACRARKVKCDRASPCSSCITRGTTSECTYATTTEDRQAIGLANLISELRETRSRLQGQVTPGQAQPQINVPQPESGSGSERQSRAQSRGRQAYNEYLAHAGDDDLAVLEALYTALSRGSVDVTQQILARIRNHDPMGEIVTYAKELEEREGQRPS